MISEGGGSSSAQIFQLDDVQGWVQNVATIIRDRDRDVDDLRRKLQGHGKERKDGKWVAHSKTWIDTEANDKRVSNSPCFSSQSVQRRLRNVACRDLLR